MAQPSPSCDFLNRGLLKNGVATKGRKRTLYGYRITVLISGKLLSMY